MKQYRAFLNKSGLGSVEVEIDKDWCVLTLSDCSRSVSLHFDVDRNKDTKARRLAKIKKIEKALALCREFVERE